MKSITRKSEVLQITQNCLLIYQNKGFNAFLMAYHQEILSSKIKFPLLEESATAIYTYLPENDRLHFCDEIEKLKTIGANVIIGKILQKRLGVNFTETIEKAVQYIAMADDWYVCDIIGERVFG